MANDKNKETKICEHCGRKLPVSEFALMHCRNYMNAKVGCSCCCIKHGNSYVYRFRLRLAGENLVSLF